MYGVEKVESLEILDEKTGAIEIIEDSGCGIFVYAGTVPNTELYNEIRLDNGFLPTDENMQTEIPGVYAVGDIRSKTGTTSIYSSSRWNDCSNSCSTIGGNMDFIKKTGRDYFFVWLWQCLQLFWENCFRSSVDQCLQF